MHNIFQAEFYNFLPSGPHTLDSYWIISIYQYCCPTAVASVSSVQSTIQQSNPIVTIDTATLHATTFCNHNH